MSLLTLILPRILKLYKRGSKRFRVSLFSRPPEYTNCLLRVNCVLSFLSFYLLYSCSYLLVCLVCLSYYVCLFSNVRSYICLLHALTAVTKGWVAWQHAVEVRLDWGNMITTYMILASTVKECRQSLIRPVQLEPQDDISETRAPQKSYKWG